MALKLVRGIFMGTGGAVILTYGTRKYREQIFKGREEGAIVHHDKTIAKIPIQSQVPATIQIIHPVGDTEEGKTSIAIVDKQKYNEFVVNGISALDKSRYQMQIYASGILSERLDKCFEPVKERVDKFADWYFAYSTSFKLIRHATSSLARHSVNFTDRKTLSEAVTFDLDNYLAKQYERIVLRPEITDTEIQAAYLECVKDIHTQFVETINKMEGDMIELLARETNHLDDPTTNRKNGNGNKNGGGEDAKVLLRLDWATQLQKIKNVPANFEKTPELTVALSASGALIGKTVGTAVAGKAAAGTAGSKIVGGKLASPFVAKVVSAGTGGLVGSLGGPIGTIFGAAMGIGIDYTTNAGIELMQREEFVKDVKNMVNATKKEYIMCLERELHRVAGVWIEDAMQILPKAK